MREKTVESLNFLLIRRTIIDDDEFDRRRIMSLDAPDTVHRIVGTVVIQDQDGGAGLFHYRLK